MLAINPYLSFSGNCEKAFDFYKSVFGGELSMSKYKDAPPDSCCAKAQTPEKIMHARLSFGPTVLMGGDCSKDCGCTEAGGGHVAINICPGSADEAKKIFTALEKGGQVVKPLEKTFWADSFGIVTDQFGVRWIINYCKDKKHSCGK